MSHSSNSTTVMSASQTDACETLMGFSAYRDSDGLAPIDLDDEEEDIALVEVIYLAGII